MLDERTRQIRRLRRLRRSARRWSVIAGGLAGAAAILTPYAGLGLPDAFWMAGAGASVVMAGWRWADLRVAAGRPLPEPADPALVGDRARERLVAAVQMLPAGDTALTEIRRQRTRFALRGTPAAGLWSRLDRAAQTMSGLSGRLTGPAGPAAREGAAAERSLRELAQRIAAVDRAVAVAPVESRAALERARDELAGQLDSGVSAYERLVAAAAAYVAEDSRPAVEHPSVGRLTEAADLLRGVAEGLAELRATTDPMRAAG